MVAAAPARTLSPVGDVAHTPGVSDGLLAVMLLPLPVLRGGGGGGGGMARESVRLLVDWPEAVTSVLPVVPATAEASAWVDGVGFNDDSSSVAAGAVDSDTAEV